MSFQPCLHSVVDSRILCTVEGADAVAIAQVKRDARRAALEEVVTLLSVYKGMADPEHLRARICLLIDK